MSVTKSKKIKTVVVSLVVVLAVISALLVVAYMNMKAHRVVPPDSITTPTQPDGTKLVTIEGELMCLPHKDPELPHTMECALGLRTPEGVYYSLQDNTPNYSLLSKAATGEMVTASGALKEEPSDKYISNGIINLKSLETKQ